MAGIQKHHDHAFAALTDCCRIWLGTEVSGALADDELDWDSFGDLAFIHNLEPLLHHLCAEQRLPRGDVPALLTDRWEKAYFENFVFNTRAMELLSTIIASCQAGGIPIVPIKGPIALCRTFSDPALRIMADLDLLCREEDLPAVVAIARECGFAGGEETAVYHSTMRHDELDLLLELHFDLYDYLPDHQQLHREILDLAQPLHCGDNKITALPVNLETAIEVAHLVNHDFQVNLKPLLDLAAGLVANPPSAQMRRILARWDLEREYALATLLVDRLFATGKSPATPALEDGLADYLHTAFEGVMHIEQLGSQVALRELAARPDFSTKLTYLARMLLPPRRRLSALDNPKKPQEDKSTSFPAAGHFVAVLQRGWRKLRRGGLARTSDAPSIKREIYARRHRH